MTLSPGTRLGPYEIVGPLGAGGMGEVFRARDPRLGRDVAIKALPDTFARDPERLARFEREARLLASLSHPNIAGIHGLEEVDGHRYLVLEYVEGPTLAERLTRGPLPIDEALDVCCQIAAGVEAAHESGVVHRDLKPGNVKLTPGGQVKVLDFGLAKGGVAGTASSDPNLSASPTMTYAPTGVGVILGTAAYMSPEQARGKAVDRRTDIWSFGCVLYECLVGRALFEGETVSDLIARILERDPDWSALPEATPARVRELLRRCLRRDARERLRDIGDARLELAETLAGGIAAPPLPARTALRRPPAWPAVALGLALAAVGAWLAFGRPARDPHLHVSITHEAGGTIAPTPAAVALSPDGQRIAYAVQDSNATELWVRDLGAEAPRRIADVTAVQDVFWSPDGRYLGFTTSGEGARLWKVPAAGGSPVSLCDVKWSRGATWGRDGDIVFAPAPESPLYRVSSSGGEVRPVTALDRSRHETGHRMPWFLPDGEHFLYAALPRGPRGWDIYVGSLHGGAVKRVLNAGSGVTYAEPGYLLYVRDSKLVAQRFDAARLEVRGDPLPIADPPPQGDVDASWCATASRDGRLVMLHRRDPDTRVEWVDRSGVATGALRLPPGRYTGLDVSPDGTSALAERTLSAVLVELWYADPGRGTTSRVSPPASYAYSPLWLPDGASFVYSLSGSDGERLQLGRIGDPGPPRALTTLAAQFQHPNTVTPDGRTLLFAAIDPVTRFDIWAAPLDGSAPARPVVRSSAWDDGGALSPDGRWLAFVSDETGQGEVYVRAFPAPGPSTRVSVDGGLEVHWAHGGRELLYRRAEPGGGTILAAPVDAGATLRVGAPRPLFHRTGLVTFSTRDGDRLLVSAESGTPPPATLALLLDWRSQFTGR